MERLFWMNRNKNGLEEIGYLLKEEQVRENLEIFDKQTFEKLLDADSRVTMEGAYSGSDTFTLTEVRNLSQIKALMTWEDYNFQEGHLAVDNNEEYPDYVDEKYRLEKVVFKASGYTSFFTPFTQEFNPTIDEYCEILGLNKIHDLNYQYSDTELAALQISVALRSGDLTKQKYSEILESYHLSESKIDRIAAVSEFLDMEKGTGNDEGNTGLEFLYRNKDATKGNRGEKDAEKMITEMILNQDNDYELDL